jgi:hypothetical protein
MTKRLYLETFLLGDLGVHRDKTSVSAELRALVDIFADWRQVGGLSHYKVSKKLLTMGS